jgi:PAS domain S-box-containing protein
MQNMPRESGENNFLALLNFIVDPSVIVDGKGRILLMNNAFEDLTGLSEQEVIGKVFLELSILSAESKKVLLENLMKRMQGLPVQPYEITFTAKGGETRYVEVKAKKINYDGQPADLVIFRDITRRKRNLAKLKEYSEKMETLVNEKIKEVKEREERYRELTESISDVFFAMDKDLRYTYWNKASEKLTGIPAKDAIGKPLTEVFPNVKGTEVEQFYREVLRTRQPQSLLNKYKMGDKKFVFEISAYPTMAGLSVFVKDVTERKKSEEALKASEKYLEEILNSVLTGVVIIDEKTHQIVDANPNALEVIGASKEHVIGKICHCFICPAEKGKCPINDLRQTVDRSERVLLRASGERVPILKTVTTITWRGHKYLIESFIDITERKKAEEALRMSEKNYREIINGMNETAWVIGFDGKFVDVNDAAVKALGYSREELLSMGPSDIDNSLSREQIKGLIKRMPADQIQVFETTHTTKDGKKIPVEISSSLVTYHGKKAILSIARNITERKQMEEVLKESEEKFRILAEQSPNMIFFNQKGRVVYANKKCEEVMGYKRKEFYSSDFDFFTLIAPESKNVLKSSFSAHTKGDEVAPFEYTLVTKEGKRIESILTTKLIKFKGETAILGTITDITERKQMEMKLREAEKRYHALFDKAPLGILLIDSEARAVEFNEEAHRQLGYSREEFAKLTVSDYEVLETPEKTKARMEKVLRTGRDEFETKHRTKTGEIRDVINTVQVIELAGKKFFHLITRDITEQKKIENELKLERDKLEAVTENIGAGLVIISKDYHVLWANDFIKRCKGDAEGKLCFATLNNLDAPCPDCGVTKVFEKGANIDAHEYCSTTIDGKPYGVEIIATPIKDKDGTVLAALELSVDITEKKRLQSELAKYSQKLEQLVAKRTEELVQTQAKLVKAEKLAAIGELAGMVGHDLRNPLTGIKGATYYLKTKYAAEMGATGKEMLETIDKAIDHSNKIINDLLEYSSKLSLEFTETTPKLLLKNALSLIEVPERIQIIDATKGKPKIKADIGNMSKVFANIITNAIDAMPGAGTLTVASKTEKDNVKIVFKDTGTGMTEETLSKLKLGFPLFTTKAKGMGFGLPICKRIVEAHGGKISLKSKLGKGTTVAITIPVNPKLVSEGEEKWIFNESVLQAMVAAQETHKR